MNLSIDFDVPVEVAFDYLVDPANRPQWQSSLRRVEGVTPAEPAIGQTWTDVTALGLQPAMETTALARPVLWTERGTWRGISAELTLHFRPRGSGCTVIAEVRVVGRGLLRPVGPVVAAAARLAVPADLRRAVRLLEQPDHQ